MTVKQSQGHQTYNKNVDLSKAIIMQSLKEFPLTVSEKKAMLKFFSSEEIG